MGGTSKQSQTTSQTATRNPWEATIEPLQGIIGQLNGQVGNAGATAMEQGAFNTLTQNALAGNPYANQIGGLATNLLNGGGADAQSGNISGALDTYKQQLTPYANGSMVGQMSPQLQGYLDTIRGDITNQVNGSFAAAGRDFSGANQQALGRGISQGLAAPLLNQYNQDVQNQISASGQLYGAGNTTAGLLSGLNQTGLANQQAGVDASTAALQARDSSANQLLNIGQQQRALPISNLANIAGLLTPIAQLGGTVDATGTQQGSQTMSPAQQAWGWMNAFSNLNKGWG